MNPENDGLTVEPAEETTAERPDWLPESFDKPEDLAKSYGELQRKLGDQGSELGRLREEREEWLETIQSLRQEPAQQQFDPMSHPLIAGAQQAMDNGDVVGVFAAFQQLMGAQQPAAPSGPTGTPLTDYSGRDLQQKMAAQHNADEEMTAEALQILESDPFISQQLNILSERGNVTVEEVAPLVDMSFRLAGSARASQEQQSLAQQQAEAERARQRKVDQEGLTPAGTTRTATPDEAKAIWEEIRGADDGRLPRIQA